jgi:hypothetical protein
MTKGTGNALESYGQEYNINPAFVLAVFKHESNYGTLGVTTQTHSPGNLRCIAGYACHAGKRDTVHSTS